MDFKVKGEKNPPGRGWRCLQCIECIADILDIKQLDNDTLNLYSRAGSEALVRRWAGTARRGSMLRYGVVRRLSLVRIDRRPSGRSLRAWTG